jgi:hypothetical protein
VGEVPTVGNRPDGFVGEMLVPATGASVLLGTGIGTTGGVGLVVGVLVAVDATTSVAVPEYDLDPTAVAVAVSCHCSPIVAWACTGTMTSSSSAWPTGRLPIVQVEPFVAGHTLNVAEPMFNAADTFAVMTTFVLAACVLHTHTTKLARLPGVT